MDGPASGGGDGGVDGAPGAGAAPGAPGGLGEVVGRVIGTEDATPLEFWVGLAPDHYLQLDDVVALDRVLPTGEMVSIYGVVSQVRARHEGARFDSDVFLISDGVLPAEVSEAAMVSATRFEPETYVPPRPGTEVRRARGEERRRALFFDQMEKPLPVGLSRDGEPLLVNLEFLDGTRGAHVNISGVSGVATKTTYATFLLYSLFHATVDGQPVLGKDALNTKALIFNVKGEDLLFLDRGNNRLEPDQRERYARLGLPVGAFRDVGILAPPRRGDANAAPQVSARGEGVRSFFWTVEEFCRDGLLPFLFADAQDERQQYSMVVHNVTRRLQTDVEAVGDGAVKIEGVVVRDFAALVDSITYCVEDVDGGLADRWAGRAVGAGTVGAFVRRLHGAVDHVGNLVRSDVRRDDAQSIERQLDAHQVTVVDLHNLNDRAQRFVVGVVLRTAFRKKEEAGAARPLQFVVLDELNKYAPREGTSPIKEILLDVAERGRSLGIVLIGAQQTASEVERRVVANAAVRVVGRLDSAESGRAEYGWLPPAQRQRATIVKPGTMLVSQPQLPVPMVVEFPFPAWATRPAEAAPATTADPDADPFAGL